MKKLILVSVISSIVSAAALAAPAAPTPADGDADSTSATLTWEAQVPTIIPGAWVTFTGVGGAMTLSNGDLNVKADGSFASTPIQLELHTYDESNNTAGPLVVVGTDQFNGVAVSSIAYTVSAPVFSSLIGTDVSDVVYTVKQDGAMIPTDTATPLQNAETVWAIEGANIGTMVGGDTVTATTVVRADVAFAVAN
ncbi:hypothetical protein [Vibrio splendidus]|uniref:hypothetical protein n=1 Tax=Vibrio splendidus TaxID=29497 RepID=UPI00148B4403|nr:hypothetical protein [Vibrio splendidus]NOJ07753.1 hypothetical protein [Vibrio splendidus]